jgi:polysaccharide pyruvyl transferase WcaK-like protein
MHLAVMSLMHGVPAVTVATQGKVEGLMELVGAPELCVATDAIASTLPRAAGEAADAADALRERIEAALPRVLELAGRNLDGLPVVRTVTSG